jgi:hypothetical protein
VNIVAENPSAEKKNKKKKKKIHVIKEANLLFLMKLFSVSE